MISKILGNYLISKGKITSEQLDDVIEEITRVRVKLGLIAVAEGMITQEQADKINRLQAVMDRRRKKRFRWMIALTLCLVIIRSRI